MWRFEREAEKDKQATKQSDTPEFHSPAVKQASVETPEPYQKAGLVPSQPAGNDRVGSVESYQSARLKQESPPVRSPKTAWPLEDAIEAQLFRYHVDNVGVWVSNCAITIEQPITVDL